MALPASGGTARTVAPSVNHIECSSFFEPRCIVGFPDGDRYVFSSLDPSTGLMEELTRITYRAPFTSWSLAPESARVAVVHGDDNVVRLIELLTGTETLLNVQGWSGFEFVAWSADGQSLFLNSGISFAGDYAALIHVNLDGRVHVLRDAPNVWHVHPVPSPDGRYLAFASMSFHGNIWLIRDF